MIIFVTGATCGPLLLYNFDVKHKQAIERNTFYHFKVNKIWSKTLDCVKKCQMSWLIVDVFKFIKYGYVFERWEKVKLSYLWDVFQWYIYLSAFSIYTSPHSPLLKKCLWKFSFFPLFKITCFCSVSMILYKFCTKYAIFIHLFNFSCTIMTPMHAHQLFFS